MYEAATCMVNKSAAPRTAPSPAALDTGAAAGEAEFSRMREQEVSLEPPTPTENDTDPCIRERKYSRPCSKNRCVLDKTEEDVLSTGSGSRLVSGSPPENRGGDLVPTSLCKMKRKREDSGEDDNPQETKRLSLSSPSRSLASSKGFKPSGFMAYASTTSPFASIKAQNIFSNKSPSTFAAGSTTTGPAPAFRPSTLAPLPLKRSGFEAFSSSSTPFASFTRAKSPPVQGRAGLLVPPSHRESLATISDIDQVTITNSNFLNSTGPVTIFNGTSPDIRSLRGGYPSTDDIQNAYSNNNHPTGIFHVESDIRCNQKADYDIYYHQLLGKGRGAPLWQPGPSMALPNEYRKRGIGIGDVGILYRSGDFDFLFNILLPAEHEINRGRVPDGFHPLERSKVESGVNRCISYGPGSFLASSSVRRSSNVNSSNFVFEATDREGAILVMPDGALSEDLRSHNLVERYIAANAKGWYKYVEGDACGRRIENGDIRVVVGFDKVSSWGMATFASNIEEAGRFEFKGVNDQQTPHKYMWDCVGSGSGRVGPQEEEIRDLIFEERHTSPLRNQCVFMRTLNFTLSGIVRSEVAVHEVRSSDTKISNSTSEKHKIGESKIEAGGVTFYHSDFAHTVTHPSQFLNKCLLEKFPKAEIVITKDSDWISVVNEDVAILDAKELCALVLASHIICEDEGVITLKRKDPGLTSERNLSLNGSFESNEYVAVLPLECPSSDNTSLLHRDLRSPNDDLPQPSLTAPHIKPNLNENSFDWSSPLDPLEVHSAPAPVSGQPGSTSPTRHRSTSVLSDLTPDFYTVFSPSASYGSHSTAATSLPSCQSSPKLPLLEMDTYGNTSTSIASQHSVHSQTSSSPQLNLFDFLLTNDDSSTYPDNMHIPTSEDMLHPFMQDSSNSSILSDSNVFFASRGQGLAFINQFSSIESTAPPPTETLPRPRESEQSFFPFDSPSLATHECADFSSSSTVPNLSNGWVNNKILSFAASQANTYTPMGGHLSYHASHHLDSIPRHGVGDTTAASGDKGQVFPRLQGFGDVPAGSLAASSVRSCSDNNLDPQFEAKKWAYKILTKSGSKDAALAKVMVLAREMKSNLIRSVFDDASQRKVKCTQGGQQRAQDRRSRHPTFVCILCQGQFTTNNSLQNHYRSHLRMDQYRCSNCGEYFRTEGIRKRHTESSQKCRRLDCSPSAQPNLRDLDTSDPNDDRGSTLYSERLPVCVSESQGNDGSKNDIANSGIMELSSGTQTAPAPM